jgi:hypothetical protein
VLCLIQLLLGFILLSNVSFEDTFTQVGGASSIIAGLGPFNTSAAMMENVDSPRDYIVADMEGLLDDPKRAAEVSSPNDTSCASCVSYILPGTLQTTAFMDGGAFVQQTPPVEGATAFVVSRCLGYQLDFYRMANVDFPSSACKGYGPVLQLCVMNANGDLVAGMF